MENAPHVLTRQIWHRLIKLQYFHGDVSGLKELEHIPKDKFQAILEYLIEHRYIYRIGKNHFDSLKYYVKDDRNLYNSLGDGGFYIPQQEFNSEVLLEYINNALSALGDLTTNPVILDPTTNPPEANIELIRESSNFRKLKENLDSKIDLSTMSSNTYDDKDSDRDKFHFEIQRENGSKVVFLAQVSGTWRAVNKEISDKDIVSVFNDKIINYINSCDSILKYSQYILKCICATSSHGVDGVQLDSFEEFKFCNLESLIYKATNE